MEDLQRAEVRESEERDVKVKNYIGPRKTFGKTSLEIEIPEEAFHMRITYCNSDGGEQKKTHQTM